MTTCVRERAEKERRMYTRKQKEERKSNKMRDERKKRKNKGKKESRGVGKRRKKERECYVCRQQRRLCVIPFRNKGEREESERGVYVKGRWVVECL